ncbi:pseudouridine synthase [Candidatus Bipolaricaulota bacterium]|nr:pseudouridine synthase [Candidatus Bipolaricaulota bacterium]
MTSDASDSKRLLQWVQQQAGISRRKAQELIDASEVDVNGKPVCEPFAVFSAEEIERLTLRGHPLARECPDPRVYRYHKPAGVLCSHDDRFYGNTVGRVLRAEGFIGYTWIGRLDQDSEGLLLLSNDGDLVHTLTHPRYEVEKVYRVWLARMPRPQDLDRALAQMCRGIDDAGDRLRILAGRVEGKPPHVVLSLTEGKKHEIKRLFEHFNLKVVRLLRISIAGVDLGNLASGAIARLSPQEIERARLTAKTASDA